jgi:hypothetical protein
MKPSNELEFQSYLSISGPAPLQPDDFLLLYKQVCSCETPWSVFQDGSFETILSASHHAPFRGSWHPARSGC